MFREENIEEVMERVATELHSPSVEYIYNNEDYIIGHKNKIKYYDDTDIAFLLQYIHILEEIKDNKLNEYLYKNKWIIRDLAENYVHKSKFKNKIEELEDTLDLCKSDGKVAKKEMYALEQQIEILEELLDERD